ncbi:MAG: hypothetical protein ISR51_08155 [Rhodospirillales bacterium]|nr:hypothetical protein [Alphaproteobacteria bacterium]MBL6948635.1 hypothetical protein [Rhodospirillales bacterium]
MGVGDEGSSAEDPEQPAIDLKRLSKILGEDDEDELFFMLGLFNNEFPKLLTRVESAIQERNARVVRFCEDRRQGAKVT